MAIRLVDVSALFRKRIMQPAGLKQKLDFDQIRLRKAAKIKPSLLNIWITKLN